MFVVSHADPCSTAASLSDSPSTNSLRQPDPEMEKYIEYAEINRALGKSTRSQRRRELEELVDVTDAPECKADIMSSARYDEIVSVCHTLIQKKKYRAAKRCVNRAVWDRDFLTNMVIAVFTVFTEMNSDIALANTSALGMQLKRMMRDNMDAMTFGGTP